MVSEGEIKILNEKIESLNQQRIRNVAHKELLKENLKEYISEYETKYGVSLSGETFAETCTLVEKEFSKVEKEISDEYEFKSKVVKAIEDKDYDTAYALLGVENENEITSVPEPTPTQEPTPTKPSQSADDLGISTSDISTMGTTHSTEEPAKTSFSFSLGGNEKKSTEPETSEDDFSFGNLDFGKIDF